ncbi:MAG: trimethylamine methyltransferase, partial [Thermoproteota archaeon]
MIKLSFPTLKILTKDQIENIHNATLEVLERTGVVFKHPEALKIFDEAGAYVDKKGQRVLI